MNKNHSWPKAHLQKITNGKITLCNETDLPIALGKDIKLCKIRTTEEAKIKPASFYQYSQKTNENIPSTANSSVQISLENVKCPKAKEIIEKTHDEFHEVFDKNLTKGYNGLTALKWDDVSELEHLQMLQELHPDLNLAHAIEEEKKKVQQESLAQKSENSA